MKSFLLDKNALIEKDGKYYTPCYKDFPPYFFEPIYMLPPEALWRIFSQYIFDGTGNNYDGKRTQGYSIRNSVGWNKLNVYPATSYHFSERDEGMIYECLRVLALSGYIMYQTAGNIWLITEL